MISPLAINVVHTTLVQAVSSYRPFLDPMPLDTYWLLLFLPLVLIVAVVYKTIKLDNLAELPQQALFLAGQIIAFMILAAAALWLVTELV